MMKMFLINSILLNIMNPYELNIKFYNQMFTQQSISKNDINVIQYTIKKKIIELILIFQ